MKAKSEPVPTPWPKPLRVIAWAVVWAYAIGLGYITLSSRVPTEPPYAFEKARTKEAPQYS